MSARLSIRESGRSRSKSPSGRPDTRREDGYRRSSKKQSDDELISDSDDDRRRSKRSSKKYYESESEEDQRKQRSSRRYEYAEPEDDRRNGKKEKIRTVDPSADLSSDPDDFPLLRQRLAQGRGADSHSPSVRAPSAQVPGAFPEGRPHETRHTSYISHDPRYAPPPPATYVAKPEAPTHHRSASSSGNQQYAQVGQFQYAQVDPQIKYKYNGGQPPAAQQIKPQVIEVDPRHSDSKIHDKRYVTAEKSSKDEVKAATQRLGRLSTGAATLGVAGAVVSNGHGKPPASPLLEAYTGTYQTISPMPNALVLAAHKNDSDISDIELASEESDFSDGPDASIKRKIRRLEKEKEWHDKKREKDRVNEHQEYERKRPSRAQYETREPDRESSMIVTPRGSRKKVSWYDAEVDAKEIAAILKGSKPPHVRPLIEILPHLNTEDLEALKVEYKKHATIGGQGINMSKHIKARVTGHLGKAAYACSLGQYESDAFWANCFYQSGASRRELLIESLMGRTNQQIREIKNFFKDKKYDDDLETCMKAELKADKFRTAILLALGERRMAESPVLDSRLLKEDVRDLYEALNSAGGESAMIKIIVVRSDAHLREALRMYERAYGKNFARDMIHKSKNLVGETLAHILNGALNRSMRDGLLLHQAIAEMAPGKERAELLISRLVRLHWEPKHLEKVKAQYASRYGVRIEDAIRRDIQSHMKTEEGLAWTNFCIELIKSSES